MRKDATGIFTRHPANPILDPADYPGVNTLFNPSPALVDGRTVLLVSCTVYDGGPKKNFRQTRLAWSDDGIRFDLETKPFVDQDALPYPYCDLGGIIDNRLQKIDDWWYFIAPQGTWEIGFNNCVSVLYRTEDFRTVELVETVALPFNRGVSLFPDKIQGKYWRLDRPGEVGTKGTIWAASSPDLVHWGCFRPVLSCGYSIWNGAKIGPTPPIRTDEGYLVIVHGVDEPCDGTHYYIGAMLLDLDDPTKIRGLTQSYLLAPEAEYERDGQVDNVVFPTGALAKPEADELWLYYGAADTRVCLAVGSLSETIRACIDRI